MAKKKAKRRSTAVKRSTRKRRTVAKKRAVKRTRKRKPAKRKAANTTVTHTVRTVSGKKRRSARKRRVVRAGQTRRRRVSGTGSGGGMGMILGLAIGAGALYLLTRPKQPTIGPYQLPPLTQTQNPTRNSQSSDLVNYAVAGGLAVDAILKLIDRLNRSSDQEVKNIYDVYHSTGELDGVYV